MTGGGGLAGFHTYCVLFAQEEFEFDWMFGFGKQRKKKRMICQRFSRLIKNGQSIDAV
jgi:hypothetical protein